MESKWQLILHEKCEDPYYEITNGPISLISNCGLVGEDDADEDNIFNRVKDELNISGIIFHSGNALEIKQHLEIQELKYKADKLAVENERLKERCEKMESGFKYAQIRVISLLAANDKQVEFIFEKVTEALKEGDSNTPAPGEGKEVLYICPCCNGDGKETCTNPDHGFIDAIGGEIHRLGCPVCGHDPNHKVKNGGACNTCNGAGKVNMALFKEFCEETGYDDEPNQITQ